MSEIFSKKVSFLKLYKMGFNVVNFCLNLVLLENPLQHTQFEELSFDEIEKSQSFVLQDNLLQ